MSSYREPGRPVDEHLRTRAPSMVELIEEAWKVCVERQRSLIGPRPPWWRFLARAEWQDRCRRYAIMTPSRQDLVDAARRICADFPTLDDALRAHGMNCVPPDGVW